MSLRNHPSSSKRNAVNPRVLLITIVAILLPLLAVAVYLGYKEFSTNSTASSPAATMTAPASENPSSPATDEGSATNDAATGTNLSKNEALSILDSLVVVQEVDKSDQEGYSRKTQFGAGWLDIDGSGCDTRNEILLREMDDVTLAPDGCRVLSGTLSDLYTGEVIQFSRSDASAVQIDHMIPLARAYALGAKDWTDAERRQFANDPDNLLAVKGSANNNKSDQGLSTWTPAVYSCIQIRESGGEKRKSASTSCSDIENDVYSTPGVYMQFDCEYAARYVIVANKYNLSISTGDKARAEKALKTCDIAE